MMEPMPVACVSRMRPPAPVSAPACVQSLCQNALLSNRRIQAVLLNALCLRITDSHYAQRLHPADSHRLTSMPVLMASAAAVRGFLRGIARSNTQQPGSSRVEMASRWRQTWVRRDPRRESCVSQPSAAHPSRGAAAPAQRAIRSSAAASAPPASPCASHLHSTGAVLNLLCMWAKGAGFTTHNTGYRAQP